MSAAALALLEDAAALRADGAALRARARRDGCLLLRGLHDPRDVTALRVLVLRECARLGWLAPDAPPDAALARPGHPGVATGSPESVALLAAVLPAPELDRLRCDPALLDVLRDLLGGDVATHQGDVCRVVFPGAPERTTPPHQDGAHVGADRECWTVWSPLGDCPLALGPLALLPGSHRGGLLAHGADGAARAAPAAGWAAADLAAGDAILFHHLTLHRALPNRSEGSLRLSVDCRYRAAPFRGRGG